MNFFVADLQTGFGPFIAVDLAWHGWSQGAIGTILTMNTIVALFSQAPAGVLVDWLHRKRLIVTISLLLTAAGGLIFAFWPSFWPVVLAQVLHGSTGAAISVAIAAISLGIVGTRRFNTRVGRNQLYNSLGTALTAATMGVLGQFLSPGAPFIASALLCIPAMIALTFINAADIDYRRARGSVGRRSPRSAPGRHVLRSRRLRTFAIAMFLFQFANASLLPLAGERLSADAKAQSEVITAMLVIVPQVVTALIATWVGRKAAEWGRKPLLLAAFVAMIPNAVLFAIAFAPWFLVPVQVLGGLTAAVIGIIAPLVVSDLTSGTGRFNASLGAVNTVSLIGASLSTLVTGFLVESAGFFTGFAILAVVALLGAGLIWSAMPETAHEAVRAKEA